MKAGPRLVGVTFIEHNQARDENTLRPRMRGRGTQPGARQRDHQRSVQRQGTGRHAEPAPHFRVPSSDGRRTSSASDGADELACATRILSTLVRRAYRRPGTDEDVQRLLPFYAAGRSEGGFDRGIQRALERVLVSPQFLFRIEHEPANVAPGHAVSHQRSGAGLAPVVLPLEQHSGRRAAGCGRRADS